jgi:hypothetical protein
MVTGSTENNGIFRVTVECLLSSGIKTHGRRLFSFIDLFPLYFIKLCLNIHPKIPLKCDFSIWAGPNPFTFWSAHFQIKLASLILYTTLVYTSTLKSSLKDISKFRYSNKKTRKNCFRYLKLMSPLNAAICTISYTLWVEWYYLKNNYLTLRSKVKVPQRSYSTWHTALWSCTHIPNIIDLSRKTKMLWPGQENTTVDSRYLEFDGTMEKIRVNRSSTQEELRRYRKCGLFNNERETTRA